jgi:hypothetical protein
MAEILERGAMNSTKNYYFILGNICGAVASSNRLFITAYARAFSRGMMVASHW